MEMNHHLAVSRVDQPTAIRYPFEGKRKEASCNQACLGSKSVKRIWLRR
jgi:hypothetical protein